MAGVGDLSLAHDLQLRPFLFSGQQRKGIAAMQSDMAELSKSAGLFEVLVPEYKQLKTCAKEAGLLKELWDMIVLVCATV